MQVVVVGARCVDRMSAKRTSPSTMPMRVSRMHGASIGRDPAIAVAEAAATCACPVGGAAIGRENAVAPTTSCSLCGTDAPTPLPTASEQPAAGGVQDAAPSLRRSLCHTPAAAGSPCCVHGPAQAPHGRERGAHSVALCSFRDGDAAGRRAACSDRRSASFRPAHRTWPRAIQCRDRHMDALPAGLTARLRRARQNTAAPGVLPAGRRARAPHALPALSLDAAKSCTPRRKGIHSHGARLGRQLGRRRRWMGRGDADGGDTERERDGTGGFVCVCVCVCVYVCRTHARTHAAARAAVGRSVGRTDGRCATDADAGSSDDDDGAACHWRSR